MRKLELEVCRQADVVFYPDPEEVRIIADEVGGDRSFIANPVYVYDEAQIEVGRRRIAKIETNSGKQLFFVGGFNHTPNRDGVLWFVREVLPLVAAEIPDVSLAIAGSNPPPEIVDLASDRVRPLGRVSDEQLAELYETAPVAIAPLRFGAGVKGKVLEAMANGVPMATTSIGAQGVDDTGNALFIGDTPGDLSAAVVDALLNRGEARRRAMQALELIGDRYSRAAMAALFRRLIVEETE
jgi:glycosyltransferase involved in cell wall biosynthesis